MSLRWFKFAVPAIIAGTLALASVHTLGKPQEDARAHDAVDTLLQTIRAEDKQQRPTRLIEAEVFQHTQLGAPSTVSRGPIQVLGEVFSPNTATSCSTWSPESWTLSQFTFC
ncbi:hypothetical protein PUV47_05480 [Pseudovibrio exalbescens]|uniref:hypothetical protein n=1 Tax=Pseudovibrio exalbescens TaxID=197461 RepID=UPI002365AFF5|nr:hypothetical protein [Pseudovibrio exalbescens]MDD7909360.1 hypothetical protein [Pseudovibrio exalbescens]